MDGPDTSPPHGRPPARDPGGPDGGAASSEAAQPSSWAPIVAEAERPVLRWILDTTRSVCRAPTENEVLIQFEQPSTWLSGLCHRGLLQLRLRRVHLTRNAARLAGAPDPVAELIALRSIPSAARKLWLSTRVAEAGVDVLARHADVDPVLLSIALTMGPGPFPIELDRESGLAATVVLGDDLLAIPTTLAEVWSGAAFEYEPPRSLAQLAARFQAGEVEFSRVEIIEGGSVRQLGDIGLVYQALDLAGLVVRSGFLRACSLTACNLRGVVLENLDLWGTLLSACDLEGAGLRSVSTPYSSFLGCNLADLSLEGTTSFAGGWIEGSAFTASTSGLRERILGCSSWQQVWIDGLPVIPADLEAADDSEGDVESPAPSAASVRTDSEPSPTASAQDGTTDASGASDCFTRRVGRISFRPRENSKNVDIVVDDEVVADAGPADAVGVRLMGALTNTRDVELHVLDVCASVDGGGPPTGGPLPLEAERAMAQSVTSGITITDEADPEKRNRRAAILRRLVRLADLLQSTAQGEKRDELEVERLELEAALSTPDYRAASAGRGGDDMIARATERLSRAYRRWFTDLRRYAPAIADLVDASVCRSSNGEFWRWSEPVADPPPTLE